MPGVDSGVTLRLDASRCRGSGVCRAQLPALLRAGEDGSTEVVCPSVSGDALAVVRGVVLDCPSGALSLDGDAFFDLPDVGP